MLIQDTFVKHSDVTIIMFKLCAFESMLSTIDIHSPFLSDVIFCKNRNDYPPLSETCYNNIKNPSLM